MTPISPLASSGSNRLLSLFLEIQRVALEGDVDGCLSLGCTLWASVLNFQRAWAGLMDETGEKLTTLVSVSSGTVERLPASTSNLTRGSASHLALEERNAVFLREALEWRNVTAGPVIVAPAYGPFLPKAILVGEWNGESEPEEDQLDLATLVARDVGFAVSAARRLTERAATTAVLEQKVRDLEQRVVTTERNRRLAEEAGQLMRRTTNRLHVALDQLPEGLAVISVPRGSLVLSNPSAGRVLAPDRAGTIRATFLNVNGLPLAPGQSPLEKASRGELFGPERVLVVTKSGRRRPITLSAAPIPDANSHVREVLLVLQYEDEPTHPEEPTRKPAAVAEPDTAPPDIVSAGHQQSQISRLLLEAAPFGVALVTSPEYRFQMANQYFHVLAAPPGLSVVGRTVADIFPPTVAVEIAAILDEVLRSRDRVTVHEQSMAASRGRDRVYWDVEYVPLPPATGQMDGVLVIASDVTERVTSRQQIDEVASLAVRKAAEFEGVLENMTDAVFVCDSRGYIKLINEAGKQMLGLGRLASSNVGGISLRKALRTRHPDGSLIEYDEQPLKRALKGERVLLEDGIIYSQVAGKELLIRTSAAPIRDEGGWIIGSVAVVRDVSALVDLDRLKDQFITVAAHELRTPVTIIKGYSQLMLRNADKLPADLARMLEAISRGATRIDDVVNDILKVPELRPRGLVVEVEDVDLAEMARLAGRRFEATSEKHQILVQTDGPVTCKVDRMKVEQVLENLLENAAKYSPEGGIIELSVTSEPERAIVSVRDAGVGIPSHKQDQLFERFYSAHTGTTHDYGGLGLGLYLSREIVTNHGGEMWFESEEGIGSCFHFSLPLAVANG